MGREVRRVPGDWKHPVDSKGNFIPLFDNYCNDVSEWDENAAKWEGGEFPSYADDDDRKLSFSEWYGKRPFASDYMPDWSESERTHYMMYETTSEGTPISPPFLTPEELAHWLADTNASAFGKEGASYEAWLNVARGEYAPSAVFTTKHGMQSGVSATLASRDYDN